MFLCCWRGPWECLVRWMIPRGRMAHRAWVDGVTFPLVPLLRCERGQRRCSCCGVYGDVDNGEQALWESPWTVWGCRGTGLHSHEFPSACTQTLGTAAENSRAYQVGLGWTPASDYREEGFISSYTSQPTFEESQGSNLKAGTEAENMGENYLLARSQAHV